MFKRILMAGLLFFSVNSFAGIELTLIKGIQNDVMEQAKTAGLKWNVGDKADYKIDMGFIKGTMKSSVREKTEGAFWVDQDMDLGMMGKQKVEIKFEQSTGRVLEIIANGKKQDLPDGSNMEVEEMKEAKVTVAAGEFDCVYVKVRDKSKDETSEAWINPDLIPISGLLKQVAPSQFGKVTVELTSFEFNN